MFNHTYNMKNALSSSPTNKLECLSSANLFDLV